MTYVNPDAEEAPEKTTLTLFAELGWQAYHKVYGDGPQESAGLYLVAELLELVGLPALSMTEGDVGMSLPEQIEDAMRNAIQDLTVVLEWEVLDAPTHRTVIVIGWNAEIISKMNKVDPMEQCSFGTKLKNVVLDIIAKKKFASLQQ